MNLGKQLDMKNKLLITGAALVLAGSQVQAADDLSTSSNLRDQSLSYDQTPAQLFRDNEASLDIFGSDTLGPHTINHPSADRIRNNSILGAGLGLNLFFCRYLGIGGDAYTENTAHSFVDNASGSVILRIPIDAIHLAPYGFAGGGYKWDPVDTSFVHAGAGLEVRFIPHLSVFVDARYVWPDRIRDYGVGRAGVRLSF
jgi:hypothetical protein